MPTLPDADQLHSTFQKADTISYATVKTQPMLHSAMELTEILSEIITNLTEVSMRSGVKLSSIWDSPTCTGTGILDLALL